MNPYGMDKISGLRYNNKTKKKSRLLIAMLLLETAINGTVPYSLNAREQYKRAHHLRRKMRRYGWNERLAGLPMPTCPTADMRNYWHEFQVNPFKELVEVDLDIL